MTLPFAPIPDSDLTDLHRRLTDVRPAARAGAGGQARGVEPADVARLIERWRNSFDWREHEARILGLPWTRAGALNVLHQPASDPDAPVVVLLHGWPDSVLRFERVLPLLRDVSVVVPALPGFPFAAPSTTDAIDAASISAAVAVAMSELGYANFVVSAGDVGADVAEQLAAAYPQRVSALHLTNISPLHAVFADRAAMSSESLAYLDVVARWSRAEGGYIAEQSSKPDTLAVGLSDSPAGLAAWIIEKLNAWSEHPFSIDVALTWISAYWFTNTIGSSFATYADTVMPVPYVQTPTVVSGFAHDTKPAPVEFARSFVNVQEFIAHEHGGHFAAWEQPEAYVRDLRAAIALR